MKNRMEKKNYEKAKGELFELVEKFKDQGINSLKTMVTGDFYCDGPTDVNLNDPKKAAQGAFIESIQIFEEHMREEG